MQIVGTLFVPKAYTELVESWWKLNGIGRLPLKSPPGCDLVLETRDLKSDVGSCLEELFEHLGLASEEGLLFNRHVIWEPSDYENAELFSLSAGTDSGALNPDSISSRSKCPGCGLRVLPANVVEGARVPTKVTRFK